jgi:hypothetical protein
MKRAAAFLTLFVTLVLLIAGCKSNESSFSNEPFPGEIPHNVIDDFIHTDVEPKDVKNFRISYSISNEDTWYSLTQFEYDNSNLFLIVQSKATEDSYDSHLIIGGDSIGPLKPMNQLKAMHIFIGDLNNKPIPVGFGTVTDEIRTVRVTTYGEKDIISKVDNGYFMYLTSSENSVIDRPEIIEYLDKDGNLIDKQRFDKDGEELERLHSSPQGVNIPPQGN